MIEEFRTILQECVFEDILKPTNIFKRIKQGDLVAIRPCEDTCEGKTYVGFYLGDLAIDAGIVYEDNKPKVTYLHNPAIFVPELKRIVYGFESWWGPIKSVEELTQITDEDISNVWYVKAIKKQMEESNDISESSEEKESAGG